MITRSPDRLSRDHRCCDHWQRSSTWQTNTRFPPAATPRRGGVSTVTRIQESSTVNPIDTPGQHSGTAPCSIGVVSYVYLFVLAVVVGWTTWSAANRTVTDVSSCTRFDVMEMFGGVR